MDHITELEAAEDLQKQHKVPPPMTTRGIAIDLLAGTVAGITSNYVGYPLDILKFR